MDKEDRIYDKKQKKRKERVEKREADDGQMAFKSGIRAWFENCVRQD